MTLDGRSSCGLPTTKNIKTVRRSVGPSEARGGVPAIRMVSPVGGDRFCRVDARVRRRARNVHGAPRRNHRLSRTLRRPELFHEGFELATSWRLPNKRQPVLKFLFVAFRRYQEKAAS